MNTWSGSIINSDDAYSYLVSHFITKTVPFKYRGIDFSFGLSQGLFSSADIDSGTRLLLKVFSNILDRDAAVGALPPVHILDAGCGAGVIGICAAAAIREMGGTAHVRCQDRDELARLVTVFNAVQNQIPAERLDAFTEPLLAGQAGARWDLILTNIPAKTGQPVLEDFVRRSTGLLEENGRVIMVAVQNLADFFRRTIIGCAAHIDHEENGAEHTVLVYGRNDQKDTQASDNIPIQKYAPISAGPDFVTANPFYRRSTVDFQVKGISLPIDTVYGAPGFDSPGAAERAAMALIEKIGNRLDTSCVLIHEPGQGFFPCRLFTFLRGQADVQDTAPRIIFSGRNILSLEAARHNFARHTGCPAVVVPAADLKLGTIALRTAARADAGSENRQFSLIVAFPELLAPSVLPTGADQHASLWESITSLLRPGGIFIAGFGSTDAERFDRRKPAGFTRLGDIKRDGFRAAAYAGS
jgi:hypothetical protein